MKTIIVIPARYKSSRFPGKPLIDIQGKPMIQWVAELSTKVLGIENVYIATDNEKIAQKVKELGYQVVITSEKCLTGTDRLAEVANQVTADIYVNVQGDEPLVNPEDIFNVIEAKKNYPNKVIAAYAIMNQNEDPLSVNIPKVIFNEQNEMIYMSRQVLPGYKDSINIPTNYYKQVCIYAFNRQELLSYGQYGKKSTLEQIEDIEILRFLEWKQSIYMVKTKHNSMSVDTPEDYVKIQNFFKNSN